MIVSETARLAIREATAADALFFLALMNEPAWHQFIYSHSIDTCEKAADYIEERVIASYQSLGFGLWVVEKRDEAKPIGLCGLLKREVLDAIDLGFAFLSAYEGQGFAKEAAIESLDYARRVIGAPNVLAITDPCNARSIKLLEALGFVYKSGFSYPDSAEVLSLYDKALS